jgi:chaperone required for assembly of F1-ATPase
MQDHLSGSAAAQLPKRFYREAGIEPREGAFALVLDGRAARTPGGASLAVRSRPLAQALAEEWQAQSDVIDPSRMPLTRIVNSAIDGVAPRPDAVRDDLLRYAGSDLVCYRAPGPDRLVAMQQQAWDPVIAWARHALHARLVLGEGVMFVEQPEATITALRNRLAEEVSPVALAALHVMTTLTGSVLIPLAHAAGTLDVDGAWNAAHVDEHFQESQWGLDLEAAQRRQHRQADFIAASRAYTLDRSDG